MKLYVWSDPYHVPYGSSMVIAIAEDLESAKKQAAIGKAYHYNQYEQKRTPKIELGEPERVLDLPCAEWHEWAE